MPEDFIKELNELLVQTENVLHSIDEIRRANNRRAELESELIEITLNQKKDDSKITQEIQMVDAIIEGLKSDIKNKLQALSNGFETLKAAYNERMKETTGEIKEIVGAEKNV